MNLRNDLQKQVEVENRKRALDAALRAIKDINDFTWKVTELAIKASPTKSLLYT
jgi:hypothetical protein